MHVSRTCCIFTLNGLWSHYGLRGHKCPNVADKGTYFHRICSMNIIYAKIEIKSLKGYKVEININSFC